jgi:hypothetical protein
VTAVSVGGEEEEEEDKALFMVQTRTLPPNREVVVQGGRSSSRTVLASTPDQNHSMYVVAQSEEAVLARGMMKEHASCLLLAAREHLHRTTRVAQPHPVVDIVIIPLSVGRCRPPQVLIPVQKRVGGGNAAAIPPSAKTITSRSVVQKLPASGALEVKRQMQRISGAKTAAAKQAVTTKARCSGLNKSFAPPHHPLLLGFAVLLGLQLDPACTLIACLSRVSSL